MDTAAAGGHTEKIFDIVYHNDDVNWKSVIYDLVRDQDMNPWNIDISRRTNQYIKIVRQLQDHDFRISGKMVLAAAILLRIKSKRLVGEDLEELDRLIASRDEEDADDFYEDLEYEHIGGMLEDSDEKPDLIPKTPQPRVRNVSVYDLVHALEQALEVKKRRVLNSMPRDMVEIPKKTVNVSHSIKNIYKKILGLFKDEKRITFSQLLPESANKETKIYTFIPLLHLTNTRKIALKQDEHFGEIDILLRSERVVDTDPFKDAKPEYLTEEPKPTKPKKK